MTFILFDYAKLRKILIQNIKVINKKKEVIIKPLLCNLYYRNLNYLILVSINFKKALPSSVEFIHLAIVLYLSDSSNGTLHSNVSLL